MAQPDVDERLDVLDRFEMVLTNGIVGTLCRRCPAVQIVARDLDGDQSGLTLAELVEEAERHEREEHP